MAAKNIGGQFCHALGRYNSAENDRGFFYCYRLLNTMSDFWLLAQVALL